VTRESGPPPESPRSVEGSADRFDGRGEIDRLSSDPGPVRAAVTTEVAVRAERDDLVLFERGQQTGVGTRPRPDELDRRREDPAELHTLPTIEAHIETAGEFHASCVLTEVGGRVRAAHPAWTLGGLAPPGE
jgi:hypothetical protein